MANIELDGTNKKIKVDSGDLTLDIPGDIILDADGADLVFADGGTNILKITNSSSDVVLQPQVDAKDIIFKQYDGRALLDINDGGFVGIYNGATGPGQLRLYEDTDNGTNYSAFQVGTQSGDITYTLPTADGSSGQVLSTNGSGTLSWATAGGSDPSSADGDTLGTASAEWSDLYLADGGVIYFGNDQEITLTHSADSGLLLKHTATADDKPINLVLQTGETDMQANDVIGKISWQAPDEGTGTDAILVSSAIQAVAEGNHRSSSNATSLQFMTGASEAAAEKMTLTSAGVLNTTKLGVITDHDVGVGVHIRTADSGGDVNAYADELVIENSAESGLTILSGATECGLIAFGDSSDNDIGGIKYCHDANTLRLIANAGERIRVGSDGDTGIGTTSPTARLTVEKDSTTAWICHLENTAGSNYGRVLQLNLDNDFDDNASVFMIAYGSSTERCKIFSDGDLQNHDNSYGAISDERIKQNITDANSQWDDIKALKVRNFKRKDDVRKYGDAAWEQIGVVAQEAELVSPKLIKESLPSSGDILSDSAFGTLYTADDPETQDAVFYTAEDQEVINGDNNIGDEKSASTKQVGDIKTTTSEKVKGMKYSVLYMKAIKCLQEAQTRIETLEAKVTALEG